MELVISGVVKFGAFAYGLTATTTIKQVKS
jgi:hypothetical protein